MKRLWLVVLPFALFLAGFIAFLLSQQTLALILLLSFGAYILMTLLLVMVRGVLLRGKTAQGKLEVVDPAPTGNIVLDEILRQMRSTGESRQVYRWLYGRGSLKADGLYKITERRLVEQGWITLMGRVEKPSMVLSFLSLNNQSLKPKANLLTKGIELANSRLKTPSQFRQRIFDFWGHLRINLPVKHPHLF